MSNIDCWNRCTICGKFIPINDFYNGKASREITQSYDWVNEDVREDFINLCKKCYLEDKNNANT